MIGNHNIINHTYHTMGRRNIIPPVILIFLFWTAQSFGADATRDCLISRLMTAEDSLTLGELRMECENINRNKEISLLPGSEDGEALDFVKDPYEKDDKNILHSFTLKAHKPNYVLFGTYNASGYSSDLFETQYSRDDIDFKKTEAQFQISIKFPLMVDLFDDSMDIYASYTSRSFWQTAGTSAPFRETNHEPELWTQFHPDWEIFGFKNHSVSFGLNHQSNGQGGVLSRSWNRLFARFIFKKDSLALSFKPWYRIPESESVDDNPDITDYLGHFELGGAYKFGDYVISAKFRNNLESGFRRGAVELGWIFPIGDYPYLRGYLQYFYGYGESLIDYDHRVNRIGVGLSVVDWL